ncbi:dTDP-4-dehydrorhamnose reductase [uncultured Aquimarina sp.]|uniref:dTDP-4-dehydrorhamnose reductase n=1 Tax=uncultured Aquimarina sp. TaxID=575652 RepID=UPI0026288E0B|nr:dTDP-4-dehydrorhamnose reductase [uncultured Aquimarina sp.]
MKNILVTGGKGQLALCIKDVEKNLPDFNFIYADYDELDITKEEEVKFFLEKEKIEYCINCAAYTAVDNAESEGETAKEVNETGARFLAESCEKYNAVFIQISTDFVFDGKQSFPYTETDKTTPLSVYGVTKLYGENVTISSVQKHFIIRTSWLYSEYGNNFLKTMLRLGEEREELSIVCDQIGTPTYAGDLAKIISKIIIEDSSSYGTYHYSNEGVASWYDFAKAIFEESDIKIKVLPIKTEAYPTPAKRPSYSVMDKTKIKETFKIEIPYWRDSLRKALSKIHKI